MCHGTIFHDINFYKRVRGMKSKSARTQISRSRTRELDVLALLALRANVENLRKKQW